MAKFNKSPEKITLKLTYAEVWKAWCEHRNYFKTPVQVAAEKGLEILKIMTSAAIETRPIEGGVLVTYYQTLDAVFAP